MTLIGLAFYAVFGMNIILEWGLIPGSKQQTGSRLTQVLIFSAIAAAVAVVNSFFFHVFFQPFGLINLVPLLNAILFSIALLVWSWIVTKKSGKKARLIDFIGKPVPVSMLVYLAVLSSTTSTGSILHIGLIAICAVLGYFAALVVVSDIMERLELVSMPETFRGLPALFVTVGLVAMAFAGVHQTFFTGLFTK
jgi:Na+-translocating ferredoxin:NAD+ oxidoreductase RnfA subunit